MKLISERKVDDFLTHLRNKIRECIGNVNTEYRVSPLEEYNMFSTWYDINSAIYVIIVA